jgi:hypothetical protein
MVLRMGGMNMKHKSRKILIIAVVCLLIGGLSLAKMAVNIYEFQSDIFRGNPDNKETVNTPAQPAGDSPITTQQPEEPLDISWVSNSQSALTEFVAGAEVELEIACNKNAQIQWDVTKGELLGKTTGNKVWWRLPENKGEYTVTVTVQDGTESKSLSRTFKVIPYTASSDPFADITALNGGVAPIVSYDSKTGIPSMIIGKYSPKKIFTAEDAIDSLNDIKVIMNIENPREEFKLLKTENRNNVTSYTLVQVYKSISVNEGYFVIDVDSNNDVQSLVGSYYPEVRLSGISIEPAIDENEAKAIVKDDLTSEEDFISKLFYPTTYEFKSVFLIVDMVHFKNPELVWEMKLTINEKTWKYFIHAQTGKIIDKFCNETF